MLRSNRLSGAMLAVLVVSTAISSISCAPHLCRAFLCRVSDASYYWKVRQDDVPDGNVVLSVLPMDTNDWTDYMAANRARIADWVSDPPAETFERKFVAVTFSRPVSLSLFNEIIAPLEGTVKRTVVVGKEHRGKRFADTYFDAPQERWFEPGVSSMWPQESAYEYTVSGIIKADLWLGDVEPGDLAAVQAHPVVHMLDTTAVQIMMDHPPDSLGGEVAAIDLDSPWHRLPWSRKAATEAAATQAAITPEPRAMAGAYP